MARRTDPSAATIKLVRERDQHRCARCGDGRKDGLSTQHRKARGMGGSRDPRLNAPANLLTLCGSGTTGCHGWVEHHPTEAKRLGYAVSRWADDPTDVPVWTWRGWVRLHDDGSTTPAEETETA